MATATESAALGVIAAIGIAACRLTLGMLLHAFEGTMRTTAMIMAIKELALWSRCAESGRIVLTLSSSACVKGFGCRPMT